ncbi:MAG TPA: RNA polymerase sigma factor [Ilumatobacter sp.]|nr:RNA polymerase sigma factor [Ilumatobacter sp.]
MDDDAELVRRMQTGDDAAFVLLVRRYQRGLLCLAESVVGSRAVAEEVTQDTWIAVVRGIEKFEGRSSFKTWLYRVLINRAHSTMTRERRAGYPDEHLEEHLDEHFGHDGHWCSPPVAWSDEVDDAIVAAQIAQRAIALLRRLPEAQRQIVYLHDVERVSAHDIEGMLGITDGNQRVLLHRGRTRLRALLGAEMGTHR